MILTTAVPVFPTKTITLESLAEIEQLISVLDSASLHESMTAKDEILLQSLMGFLTK